MDRFDKLFARIQGAALANDRRDHTKRKTHKPQAHPEATGAHVEHPRRRGRNGHVQLQPQHSRAARQARRARHAKGRRR